MPDWNSSSKSQGTTPKKTKAANTQKGHTALDCRAKHQMQQKQTQQAVHVHVHIQQQPNSATTTKASTSPAKNKNSVQVVNLPSFTLPSLTANGPSKPTQSTHAKPAKPHQAAGKPKLVVPPKTTTTGKPNQQSPQKAAPGQHRCKICGHNGHKEADCSHKDASCFLCRKKGHIASVCRESLQKLVQPQQAVQVHVHVPGNTVARK